MHIHFLTLHLIKSLLIKSKYRASPVNLDVRITPKLDSDLIRCNQHNTTIHQLLLQYCISYPGPGINETWGNTWGNTRGRLKPVNRMPWSNIALTT